MKKLNTIEMKTSNGLIQVRFSVVKNNTAFSTAFRIVKLSIATDG